MRPGGRDGGTGALIRIRTGDLVLTKNALCQLSYEGVGAMSRRRWAGGEYSLNADRPEAGGLMAASRG